MEPLFRQSSAVADTGPGTAIDRERIRKMIPHAGSMCLLDKVLDFDAGSIRCETRSHLAPGNPLRREGRLTSLCGIEYAAQAMAVHGALKQIGAGDRAAGPGAPGEEQKVAPLKARHGYLASVRDTRCASRYLDEHAGPLIVAAELLLDEDSRVIYAFTVSAGALTLLSGRAAVVLG